MEYTFWRSGKGVAELENLCSEAKSTLAACVKEAKAFGGSIPEGVLQDMSAAVEEVGRPRCSCLVPRVCVPLGSVPFASSLKCPAGASGSGGISRSAAVISEAPLEVF